jgi:hypothetical protein
MDLCKKQMTRTRVKGNGSKAASSPSTEPNFYTMEPCYEQAALSDVMITDIQARLHEDTSKKSQHARRLQKAIDMVKSIIISFGSEASDKVEESHSDGNTESQKTTRVTRTRGGAAGARSSSNGGGGRSSRTRRSSASKQHVKHYVEHNYHDHLHDTFLAVDQEADESLAKNHDDHRCGHRGGVAVPFPEKLYYMLSQMDQNEKAHIVNWQPHGRCFVVHKPKEFVEEIMPR